MNMQGLKQSDWELEHCGCQRVARVGATFSWLNSLMNNNRSCSSFRGSESSVEKERGRATAPIEVYACDWPHVASRLISRKLGNTRLLQHQLQLQLNRLLPGLHVHLQSQQREICGWGIETNHLDWWLAFRCQLSSCRSMSCDSLRSQCDASQCACLSVCSSACPLVRKSNTLSVKAPKVNRN